MSEDSNQLLKYQGEYGIMTPHVRLLQEAVDLVNKRLVTVAYGMGDAPEVAIMMQDGLLTGPVPQLVVTPRWYRPTQVDGEA